MVHKALVLVLVCFVAISLQHDHPSDHAKPIAWPSGNDIVSPHAYVNESDWLCGSESCPCATNYAMAALVPFNTTIPPTSSTPTWGIAQFHFQNATVLRFIIFVQGVRAISVAHLHFGRFCLEEGEFIMAFAHNYGASNQTDLVSGIFAQGIIDGASFEQEQQVPLVSLWNAMLQGSIYVNVHAAFEGKEEIISGQIVAHKK